MISDGINSAKSGEISNISQRIVYAIDADVAEDMKVEKQVDDILDQSSVLLLQKLSKALVATVIHQSVNTVSKK